MDASPHLMAPTQEEEFKGDKRLERFQPDWKRFNSNFVSNFIDLTSLRYFQSA
jgi:hypothetical protein